MPCHVLPAARRGGARLRGGILEKFIAKEGQTLIGWRDVPVNTDGLGKTVLESMPVIRQCIIARGENCADQDAFERKILAIRKQTQNPLKALAEKHGLPGLTELYMPSFSTRTIVYKGLLLATQVGSFYPDLTNPLCVSALGLVHQRFRPTPSPAGSWRTRSASSRITAKSTPCAAM
jgi:glutamate synthase (NADPH/NADH) large chain